MVAPGCAAPQADGAIKASAPSRELELNTADLVVVGGGPAGAAAAITARAHGLSVVLLEREAAAIERPGESAHPGIEPLLAKLGVLDDVLAAGFVRHEGHWAAWGEPSRFVPFGRDARGSWRGYQLWRPVFDSLLLEHAGRTGACVLRPCPNVTPVVERRRVTGVRWRGGALRARFVVDATGRRRWLAKALGLPCDRESRRLIAWFGYARGSYPPCDAAPAISANSSGWTWTARVWPGVYQWVRLILDESRLDPDWRPPEFTGLVPVRRALGADVSWTRVRPAAGPGYFLAGDAAAVLDPTSSHGVLAALMSGMAVAHAVAAVVRGISPPIAAKRYDAWVGARFLRETAELSRAYAILTPGFRRGGREVSSETRQHLL
jgi:flavin-dependent dehydrogenase